MALVQNANGTWDFVIDTNSNPAPYVQLTPGYLPEAPLKYGASLPDTGSQSLGWFDNPSVNANDIGLPSYQGGGFFDRAKAQASRLVDSVKNGVAAIGNGVITPITNVATNINSFWQSTMWKVMIIVVVGAIATLFIMSFVQAKAGRIANA